MTMQFSGSRSGLRLLNHKVNVKVWIARGRLLPLMQGIVRNVINCPDSIYWGKKLTGPEFFSQPGGNVYVVEAPVWDSNVPNLVRNDHLLVGITPKALRTHAERGLSSYVGQLYGVVTPGLIFAKYLFRGLKRGMMVGENGDIAGQKLAASWDQPRDAFLDGGPQNPILRYRDAAPGRVFVVYLSQNEMLSDFPQLYGWLEHWTWVAADPETVGAPIDWKTRYDERLWVAPQARGS